MRYLWSEKGLTFSNDDLMSAALIIGILPQQDTTARSVRLRRSLIRSIKSQNLSEDELFAIFLAAHSCMLIRDERWVHALGFEAVLRFLLTNSPKRYLSRPLCYIFTSMIIAIQTVALCRLHNVADGPVYELVRSLDDLLHQLQPLSHSLDLLIGSAALAPTLP
jgi:hypothetical protein